ncbi:Protein of unknown function [Herbiconiux ginsengi]|uniref:DUF559 domain-containing protein n=2 Tax=Herbiconiux ginsengi TaxID=381665 RepID=A0A1H3SSA6_9MICO|nr:Protein of unknown function [Herbiconiux ginsengi]
MPPGGAFSHITAALLHGIPVPERFEHDAALHVVVPGTRRAVGARGVRGHEMQLPPKDVVHRQGLPITSVERTRCDLGAMLDRTGLLAAGDRILFHDDPLAARESLTDAVDRYRGRRGIRALRTRRRADRPADLAYPAWKVAIEYEGDHHRTDQRQWRRDIARARALQALGWTVIRVTLADLVAPAEALAAIRHHLTTPLTRTFSQNDRRP